MHYHRVGRVTTPVALVGIGVEFGNPSIEAILRSGGPRILNTIWDSTFKLKAGGVTAS